MARRNNGTEELTRVVPACHQARLYEKTPEVPEENSPVVARGGFLTASESVRRVKISEPVGSDVRRGQFGASAPGMPEACGNDHFAPASSISGLIFAASSV